MWGCSAILALCLSQQSLLDALPGKFDLQSLKPRVLELEWRLLNNQSAWSGYEQHERLLLGQIDLERHFSWQDADEDFVQGGFVEASSDRQASLAVFGLVGYSEQLQGYKDIACFRQWHGYSRNDRCESQDFGDELPMPMLGAGIEWRAGEDVSVRFEAISHFEDNEFKAGGMLEFKIRF